jgi:nitrile hydratase subunit beta
MNGVHDMGGLQNFGPVLPEPDEPVFHALWERRVFALTLAMARPGGWTLDASRHAKESLPPADYLAFSYYEIWLAGLEKLMLERGLVTAAELETGRAAGPAQPVPAILAADAVRPTLMRGGPADRPAATAARFALGDRVLALNLNPSGHTRLPRYVRGRTGTVTHVHGCHVLPDANAHGRGEEPHWLYGVSFSARELWGPEARPFDQVQVDLWEPYLDAA